MNDETTNSSQTAAPVVQGVVMPLVVGDSWSAAREADTGRDAGWPDIMGIPAELRQAVAGSTAAQWAADFEGRLSRAVNTSADVLVMSLLGNDAFAAIADGTVTTDEVVTGLQHLRAVVSRLLRQRTIVLLYADPFCGANPQTAMAVPMLNGAIRTALWGLPVVFADTGAWLKPEHFDARDIHPTRAGYAVIAAELGKMLQV